MHRSLVDVARDENVDGHNDIPESIVAQKNYSQNVTKIREVVPDVALVHTR
jgi:hypothetical protein